MLSCLVFLPCAVNLPTGFPMGSRIITLGRGPVCDGFANSCSYDHSRWEIIYSATNKVGSTAPCFGGANPSTSTFSLNQWNFMCGSQSDERSTPPILRLRCCSLWLCLLFHLRSCRIRWYNSLYACEWWARLRLAGRLFYEHGVGSVHLVW